MIHPADHLKNSLVCSRSRLTYLPFACFVPDYQSSQTCPYCTLLYSIEKHIFKEAYVAALLVCVRSLGCRQIYDALANFTRSDYQVCQLVWCHMLHLSGWQDLHLELDHFICPLINNNMFYRNIKNMQYRKLLQKYSGMNVQRPPTVICCSV